MDSPLSFGATEKFRKDLLVKNLPPYKNQNFSSNGSAGESEFRLREFSVADSLFKFSVIPLTSTTPVCLISMLSTLNDAMASVGVVGKDVCVGDIGVYVIGKGLLSSGVGITSAIPKNIFFTASFALSTKSAPKLSKELKSTS